MPGGTTNSRGGLTGDRGLGDVGDVGELFFDIEARREGGSPALGNSWPPLASRVMVGVETADPVPGGQWRLPDPDSRLW